MKCIVLSGATVPYIELIRAVDHELAKKLLAYGYDEIEVQYGYAQSSFDTSVPNTKGFDFDPRIKARVDTSQLAISHAGSGSILDSVERGYGIANRKVIVVVNDRLMDNHQLELARKLESEGCVMVCKNPSELPEAIDHSMRRNFTKLAPPNSLQPMIDALFR